MRYSISVDDKELAVDLARTADGRYVARYEADGVTRELEVSVLGDSPTLAVVIEGRVVELIPTAAGSATARGTTRVASAGDARRKRQGALAGASASSFELKAPMPGRIVKVLVTPGQSVSAGAAAIVMEAMKMENELSCPRAGTVRSVLVESGAAVERGAVLVVIE